MDALKKHIASSGITITSLASKMNISREGLYLKLNGQTEFKASEIVALREALHLTAEEQEEYFFRKNSELNITLRRATR